MHHRWGSVLELHILEEEVIQSSHTYTMFQTWLQSGTPSLTVAHFLPHFMQSVIVLIQRVFHSFLQSKSPSVNEPQSILHSTGNQSHRPSPPPPSPPLLASPPLASKHNNSRQKFLPEDFKGWPIVSLPRSYLAPSPSCEARTKSNINLNARHQIPNSH